jgi:hypothetical protein
MNGIAVSWTVVFLPNKSMNIPANREPTGVEMTPKLAEIIIKRKSKISKKTTRFNRIDRFTDN